VHNHDLGIQRKENATRKEKKKKGTLRRDHRNKKRRRRKGGRENGTEGFSFPSNIGKDKQDQEGRKRKGRKIFSSSQKKKKKRKRRALFKTPFRPLARCQGKQDNEEEGSAPPLPSFTEREGVKKKKNKREKKKKGERLPFLTRSERRQLRSSSPPSSLPPSLGQRERNPPTQGLPQVCTRTKKEKKKERKEHKVSQPFPVSPKRKGGGGTGLKAIVPLTSQRKIRKRKEKSSRIRGKKEFPYNPDFSIHSLLISHLGEKGNPRVTKRKGGGKERRRKVLAREAFAAVFLPNLQKPSRGKRKGGERKRGNFSDAREIS